jgi:S-adenosyl methyltransferase
VGKAGGLAVAWDQQNGAGQDEPVLFDTSLAHCARVYDYWLGGKDNFAADRRAAERAIRDCPEIVPTARANRGFLARSVQFLAADAGIRQFLDIGTGIPTENNTHEVAQAVAPASRVVYVDNDPLILSHARALLASHPDGATAYEEADLRDPERLLDLAASLLDLRRPVAVLLLAILHHVDDEDDPHKIVATLMNAVPPGSYLVVSHPASDIGSEAAARMAQNLNEIMAEKITARDHATVARFFDGLELVAPGLVRVSDWRPPADSNAGFPAAIWAGVARK